MAANTLPAFSLTANISSCTLSAANTAKDGTGTTGTAFTADATNGSNLVFIRCVALGSNTASVARFFVNNGSSSATPANNFSLGEVSLPATTLSEVGATQSVDFACGIWLPAGYKILVALGTAVAAGWAFTAVGENY
jgi:hypothetical protein